MTTELIVSFTVDGIHFWPDAPEQYKEFGQPHRHPFKFVCWMPVEVLSSADRPVELWELRQRAITVVVNTFHINMTNVCDFGEMSCEGIAQWLKDVMPGFSKVYCGEEYWLGAMCYE